MNLPPFSRSGCNYVCPFGAGLRNSNTSTNNQGKITNTANGYYWSAVPQNTNNGRYLNFNSGNVNPMNNTNRAYGFPVRPVLEEFAHHLSRTFYN